MKNIIRVIPSISSLIGKNVKITVALGYGPCGSYKGVVETIYQTSTGGETFFALDNGMIFNSRFVVQIQIIDEN